MLEVIKADKLLRQYGTYQIERLGSLELARPVEVNNIRNKLRSIARMVLKLRETGEGDLINMIKPQVYERFVSTVRQMALQSDQLGLTLGIYVKQLSLLKIADCIAAGNRDGKQDAEDFLQLYNASWVQRVSSHIGRRQRLKKLNKSHDLPIEEDLRKLTRFLESEIKSTVDVQRLKMLTLSSLILFNKRRPMEVHEMTVEDFRIAREKTQDPHDAELLNKMTPTEKAIANRYVHVNKSL